MVLAGCMVSHARSVEAQGARDARDRRGLNSAGARSFRGSRLLPLYEKDNFSRHSISDDLVVFDDALRLLDPE